MSYYGKHFSDNDVCVMMDELNAAFPHYMLYHNDSRNHRTGYCTFCGDYIEADKSSGDLYNSYSEFFKAKHGTIWECPSCGFSVRYIAEGKMTTYGSLGTVRYVVAVKQISENDVCFLACRVRSSYDPYDGMQYDIDPVAYYELSPGRVVMERYRYGAGWTVQKRFGEPFSCTGGFYNDIDYEFVFLNVDEDFCGCFLKYSCLELFMDLVPQKYTPSRGHLHPYRMMYLCYYALYPQLEYLLKSHGSSWVFDLVYERKRNRQYIDLTARSFSGLFRMSKAEVNAYRKCNFDRRLLELWHDSPGGMSFEELCLLFVSLGKDFAKRLPEVVDKIHTFHLDPHEVCCYLKIQGQAFGSNAPCARAFEYWQDYLDACEMLRENLAKHVVLFPQDLIAAHDEKMTAVRCIQNPEMLTRYSKSLAMRDVLYCFEDERFLIRLPHFPLEITIEGKNQENCVANYIDRHMKGETTICFLREKSRPQDSFITIEIQGKRLIQCYGYLNDNENRVGYEKQEERERKWQEYMKRPREEALAFRDRWLEWVKAGSPRDVKGNPIEKNNEEVRKHA